jgi:hypothetical protein
VVEVGAGARRPRRTGAQPKVASALYTPRGTFEVKDSSSTSYRRTWASRIGSMPSRSRAVISTAGLLSLRYSAASMAKLHVVTVGPR